MKIELLKQQGGESQVIKKIEKRMKVSYVHGLTIIVIIVYCKHGLLEIKNKKQKTVAHPDSLVLGIECTPRSTDSGHRAL